MLPNGSVTFVDGGHGGDSKYNNQLGLLRCIISSNRIG